MNLREAEPLAKYTSWRVGGTARYLAEPSTPEELQDVLAWATTHGYAVAILGGGTNTLVRDAGWDGLVIRYRDQRVELTETEAGALVRLGAGAPTAGSVRKLARQGWGGFEWAEGLPGTIGGAIYGNAGCYGSDMAAIVTRAWLLSDGAVAEWPVEQLGFGYRTSALKRITPAPIVLAAEVRLERADPQLLAERMEQTAAARRSKTPAGQSCGSVFKNPPGESAGRLIEAAGLKGLRIGAAEVAQKHANYIVNTGGAASSDILALIEAIREGVRAQFGITLETEVQILGERIATPSR
ncbi:MAG: UDP-N-acetylmuramate dehydrogenase [Roseiflexaceae bacterium]